MVTVGRSARVDWARRVSSRRAPSCTRGQIGRRASDYRAARTRRAVVLPEAWLRCEEKTLANTCRRADTFPGNWQRERSDIDHGGSVPMEGSRCTDRNCDEEATRPSFELPPLRG